MSHSILAPKHLLIAAVSLSIVACGSAVGSIDGDAEASTSISTGEAPDSTSSSSMGSEASGSESSTTAQDESSSETTTTAGAVDPVCGDGVVEGDEPCDDGNEENEDGCNADCTVSGSLLWSWEPPDGSGVHWGAFGPSDRLHLLVGSNDGLTLNRFDAAGEVEETLGVTPVPAPSPIPKGQGGIVDFAGIAIDTDASYVSLYEYWESDGTFYIDGQVERVGEGGWVQPIEGGTTGLTLRPGGGAVVVSADHVVFAFDADGTPAWSFVGESSLRWQPFALADAVVVAGPDRVIALDAEDGAERWTFVEPEPEMRLDRAVRSADEIWVSASGPVGSGESYIFRLELDGTLIEQLEGSDLPFVRALTSSGNPVIRARQELDHFVEKLDPGLELLWAYDIGTDEGWQNLAVDAEGAVAVVKTRDVRVLAP